MDIEWEPILVYIAWILISIIAMWRGIVAIRTKKFVWRYRWYKIDFKGNVAVAFGFFLFLAGLWLAYMLYISFEVPF